MQHMENQNIKAATKITYLNPKCVRKNSGLIKLENQPFESKPKISHNKSFDLLSSTLGNTSYRQKTSDYLKTIDNSRISGISRSGSSLSLSYGSYNRESISRRTREGSIPRSIINYSQNNESSVKTQDFRTSTPISSSYSLPRRYVKEIDNLRTRCENCKKQLYAFEVPGHKRLCTQKTLTPGNGWKNGKAVYLENFKYRGLVLERQSQTSTWDWIIVNKYNRSSRNQLFKIKSLEKEKSNNLYQDSNFGKKKYTISCYKSYIQSGYGSRVKQEPKFFDIGGIYPGPGEKVFAGRWKGSGYGHSFQTFVMEEVSDVSCTKIKLKTVRNLVLGISRKGNHLEIQNDTGSSSQYWRVLD